MTDAVLHQNTETSLVVDVAISSECEKPELDVADSKKKKYNRIGKFYWEDELTRKQTVQLSHIHEFFTDERLKTILLPIIAKKNIEGVPKLSLRAIDWLVTNYSKAHPIVYKVTPPNSTEVLVNIYRSYKSWLWTFKRKSFDPFRRRKRLFFKIDGQVHQSTVGQLNFIFWAARHGVLEYAKTHIEAIERDQAESTKNTPAPVKDGRKRKRRQLSQAPKASCCVYPTTIKLTFNP